MSGALFAIGPCLCSAEPVAVYVDARTGAIRMFCESCATEAFGAEPVTNAIAAVEQVRRALGKLPECGELDCKRPATHEEFWLDQWLPRCERHTAELQDMGRAMDHQVPVRLYEAAIATEGGDDHEPA